jgi:N-acylneuraminate cytidylyltransferase
MHTKIIALIPMRKGSQGLPGKNIRPLAGKPLFHHTIEQARAAGIDDIFISTDIDTVSDYDLGESVCVLERPAELCTDITPMADVIQHVVSQQVVGSGTIVLLQVTSPLRAPCDIRRAISLHASGRFDLVLSATRTNSGVLKYGSADGDRFLPLSTPEACFANRASLPPVYRPDGAVFVFDADWFRRMGTLACENIGFVETPAARAIDIDNLSDFEAVEAMLSENSRRG